MLKLYALIAAVAIVASGLGVAYVQHLRRENASLLQKYNTAQESLRIAQATRKRDQAALGRLARENALAASAAASAAHSLADSLATSQDWSSTPVPKEVQDALTR